MTDFLRFMDYLQHSFPVHVEIYYNGIMDWCIRVYRKGCASEYPDSPHEGSDAILCDVQHCDMELAFAMAHVAVKEWLFEYNGGY